MGQEYLTESMEQQNKGFSARLVSQICITWAIYQCSDADEIFSQRKVGM